MQCSVCSVRISFVLVNVSLHRHVSSLQRRDVAVVRRDLTLQCSVSSVRVSFVLIDVSLDGVVRSNASSSFSSVSSVRVGLVLIDVSLDGVVCSNTSSSFSSICGVRVDFVLIHIRLDSSLSSSRTVNLSGQLTERCQVVGCSSVSSRNSTAERTRSRNRQISVNRSVVTQSRLPSDIKGSCYIQSSIHVGVVQRGQPINIQVRVDIDVRSIEDVNGSVGRVKVIGDGHVLRRQVVDVTIVGAHRVEI